MNLFLVSLRVSLLLATLLFSTAAARSETFRVATYNLENYLDEATQTRYVKSAEAKAKIRESIKALRPDLLAMEEMGSPAALEELRTALGAEGLSFPYQEFISGHDTNVHIAVLSRFPFVARHPHTNDTFLLSGRRFRVGRGFAELDVRVNTNYVFTLFAAHLKSKRVVPEADDRRVAHEIFPGDAIHIRHADALQGLDDLGGDALADLSLARHGSFL